MARDRKYSRILQAAKYYSAIDNYIKYITDASKRGQRVGTGQPRPKSKKYFIKPFGITLATAQVIPVTAAETAFATYTPFLSGRFQATESTAANIIRPYGYTAARAIITTGRSTTGVAKTSKVTGMKYLDYGGKSTSVAFGAKATNEDYGTAIEDVLSDIQAGVSGSIVTFRPEIIAGS